MKRLNCCVLVRVPRLQAKVPFFEVPLKIVNAHPCVGVTAEGCHALTIEPTITGEPSIALG